jgi:hypothetical protein
VSRHSSTVLPSFGISTGVAICSGSDQGWKLSSNFQPESQNCPRVLWVAP